MITIRNKKYVDLDHDALYQVILRYVRRLKLKYDISITYDKRLTDVSGYFDFSKKNKMHIIQISPFSKQRDDNRNILKYKIISSLLHELKHCQQLEQHGYQTMFHSKYCRVDDIKNIELSMWYSECEAEARAYENKTYHKAVDYYDSLC